MFFVIIEKYIAIFTKGKHSLKINNKCIKRTPVNLGCGLVIFSSLFSGFSRR